MHIYIHILHIQYVHTDLPYFSSSMKAAEKYVVWFNAANFMFSFASAVPVCLLAIVILGVVATGQSCRKV